MFKGKYKKSKSKLNIFLKSKNVKGIKSIF